MVKQTRMTAREWTQYQRTNRYDSITPAGAGQFAVALLGGRITMLVTVDGEGAN